MQRKKSQQDLLNWDKVLLSDLKIIFLGKGRKTLQAAFLVGFYEMYVNIKLWLSTYFYIKNK